MEIWKYALPVSYFLPFHHIWHVFCVVALLVKVFPTCIYMTQHQIRILLNICLIHAQEQHRLSFHMIAFSDSHTSDIYVNVMAFIRHDQIDM